MTTWKGSTEKKTNHIEDQVLTFAVGDGCYGVGILQVQEIRRWSVPTRLPHVPPAILGVINVRGVVIPIVDLRTLLGMEPVAHGPTSVVILLRVQSDGQDRCVGLAVERVLDVRSIPASARTTPENDGGGIIAAISTQDDDLLVLLEPTALLPRHSAVAAAENGAPC